MSLGTSYMDTARLPSKVRLRRESIAVLHPDCCWSFNSWPHWYSPTGPYLISEVVSSRASSGLTRRGPTCFAIHFTLQSLLCLLLSSLAYRFRLQPFTQHEPLDKFLCVSSKPKRYVPFYWLGLPPPHSHDNAATAVPPRGYRLVVPPSGGAGYDE